MPENTVHDLDDFDVVNAITSETLTAFLREHGWHRAPANDDEDIICWLHPTSPSDALFVPTPDCEPASLRAMYITRILDTYGPQLLYARLLEVNVDTDEEEE